MNIRAEVRLEIIRDNLTYYLGFPTQTTHDVALSIIEEFRLGVEEMKKAAEEAQKKASESQEVS